MCRQREHQEQETGHRADPCAWGRGGGRELRSEGEWRKELATEAAFGPCKALGLCLRDMVAVRGPETRQALILVAHMGCPGCLRERAAGQGGRGRLDKVDARWAGPEVPLMDCGLWKGVGLSWQEGPG